MSAARPGRVVVIGLGNRVRGDDAAGLEVAGRLRRAAPAGVEVVEHEGDAAALLDHWQGAALAVVVDAVRAGGEPGSLHRLEVVPGGQAGSGIADRAWQVSSHALGLAEAVGLAGALGRLPGRLVLVGIEGGVVRRRRRPVPAGRRDRRACRRGGPGPGHRRGRDSRLSIRARVAIPRRATDRPAPTAGWSASTTPR
ncbi:MAG TPA: hydrogenase maturation protease [Actinomycetes bacterium]|nr:hydrogenase maturation protease [Actinomycetes bacterium]